jgi:hypothetical protein
MEKNKMLNISTVQLGFSTRWERIQQPVHGTGHPADTLRLLAALDEGWQIVEAADYLAHGSNAEGRGYLLTLLHPHRLITREWSVARSPQMDSLLAFEGVPGFRN